MSNLRQWRYLQQEDDDIKVKLQELDSLILKADAEMSPDHAEECRAAIEDLRHTYLERQEIVKKELARVQAYLDKIDDQFICWALREKFLHGCTWDDITVRAFPEWGLIYKKDTLQIYVRRYLKSIEEA